MDTRLTRAASLSGAVFAAVAASACCIGPLLFALLGIGGAGFLVALEPYRPVFTALTVSLLGIGFFLTYRPRRRVVAGGDAGGGGVAGRDCGCENGRTKALGKRTLWVATAIVALALLFPYLTPYIF